MVRLPCLRHPPRAPRLRLAFAEYGALDKDGRTPNLGSRACGFVEVVRLLCLHGRVVSFCATQIPNLARKNNMQISTTYPGVPCADNQLQGREEELP